MVGRFVSFWHGVFSGAFAVSFRDGTSLFCGSLYGHTDEIINEEDPGALGYIGDYTTVPS